jgi:hypothetical protein
MTKRSTSKLAVTVKKDSHPYPRDYSLRVFYGPGLNPSIDQALNKIVGRQPCSSGQVCFGRRERDLEWDFRIERSAVAAANRIINRVAVPGGKLTPMFRRCILDCPQKIRRVEVWEEAPRRILSVGFQVRRRCGA